MTKEQIVKLIKINPMIIHFTHLYDGFEFNARLFTQEVIDTLVKTNFFIYHNQKFQDLCE